MGLKGEMWYPMSSTGLQQHLKDHQNVGHLLFRSWLPLKVTCWFARLSLETREDITSSSNVDPASTFCSHFSFGCTVSSAMISMLWSNKMGSNVLFLLSCFCEGFIVSVANTSSSKISVLLRWHPADCWIWTHSSCFSDLERDQPHLPREGKGWFSLLVLV